MMHKKAVSYREYQTESKTTDIKKSELAGTLVVIQDYDPAHHSLKLTRLSDGKPVVDKITTTENVQKTKIFEQPVSISFKTLAAPDSPILEVDDTEASLRGSATNGFHSTREFGNIVKGPISFSAEPHEMRVSGLMTFHPLLSSGFPSTIVTPIPTFQWSLPSATMLGPIAKDIALIGTMVGIF